MSPWAPLRHKVFAALFAAQMGSNIGSFVQVVAAAWLMGDLTDSPTLVALVQTATLLPVLLLGLIAGALADILDRRTLLLATQAWMLVCAGGLAALTMLDLVTPTVLLALTFAMGVGAALMGPAWQAIQPDLVPRKEFGQAIALSSMTYNTGRTVGPALGGALVATAGPQWAFVVNAASFVGVMIVLVMWKPQQASVRLHPETLSGAMRTGWRYGANAPALRLVLMRSLAFAPAATAIQALLPTVVRVRLGLGSAGYGILFGCYGVGAVLAAVVRPRLDRSLTPHRIVVGASAIVAATTVAVGTVQEPWIVGVALFVAGGAWTTVTVTLTVAAQRALPWWVRARGIGIYMVTLMGGVAVGSAVWGVIAGWSIPAAHVAAAATLVLGIGLTLRRRLAVVDAVGQEQAAGTEPMVNMEPGPDAGPVLVTLTYRVPAGRQEQFAEMMRWVGGDRRRSGASQWGLFRDLADTDVFLETFVVATWAEHMRQHHRRTVNADVVQRQVREFVVGDVSVSHLVSAYADGALAHVDGTSLSPGVLGGRAAGMGQ